MYVYYDGDCGSGDEGEESGGMTRKPSDEVRDKGRRQTKSVSERLRDARSEHHHVYKDKLR